MSDNRSTCGLVSFWMRLRKKSLTLSRLSLLWNNRSKVLAYTFASGLPMRSGMIPRSGLNSLWSRRR